MEQTTPCTACGAPVGAEELAQGLAVKVSGRLLCPLCVDHLPGDAKIMVNQMRALRGLAVTTYRYFSGRHPRLPMYTFTTANLVLMHRRKVAHGEPFEAPPLPPPDSRPRMPSAVEAGRGERSGWITVAGVIVLLVSGIIWLAVPARPAAPVPRPQAAAPPAAVQPAITPEPPARNPANDLTELDRRFRIHPDQALAVADAAELLRDANPRDIALRNRADSLAREARAMALASQPPAEVPKPVLPRPEPNPEPAPPQAPPVAPAPEPTEPVAENPEPAPRPIQPEPQQPPAQPPVVANPAPNVEPVQPKPQAKPQPQAKPPEATSTEVVVIWPKVKPVLEPGGLPRSKELPWPWPTGEAIQAGAMDSKLKPRRLAIEVRLAGVSPGGGATIVVHPGKADRSQLQAIWTDGTATVGPITVDLNGLRWQAVAIPATGCEVLDQLQLRLRLEDVRELGEQRPFLVAGASTRSEGTPTPADHPPRLPILLPPAFEAANGWSTFRTALKKQTGKACDDRQFAFAKAKVLLPFKDQGAKFRTALREQLATLLRIDRLPNGNPDDLPFNHADFASPIAGWPADGMGDLDQHPAVVFGWRSQAWGSDEDLTRRLDALLKKMLTLNRTLRRPSVVPVLVVGEIDNASAAERAAIDRRWQDQAVLLAAAGIPVIDLRPAQSEPSTDAVQRTAAAMLADGLRQFDWMLKL